MAKLALGTLAFLALHLNFDIIHRPIATVIPTQPTNANIFIYTGMQIGTGSLAPRMYYRTREFGGTYGNFNEIIGTSTGSGKYTFDLSALPNGTLAQYYIAAQDENATIVRTSPLGGGGFNPPGNIPPATFYEFLVADLEVVWSDSAINLTNWTKTGGWDTTYAKYVSSPTSFTDSPGGNYPPNTNAMLTYINQFPAVNGLKTFLEFDTQWAMEYGFDYAGVEITTNNGSTWYTLSGQYTFLGRYSPDFQSFKPIYGGIQPTWVHEIMDISNYASQSFKFRYLLKSDDVIFMDGWYIDNIKISKYGVTDVEDTKQLPTEFLLLQNYPNPFNPSTKIKYSIPQLSNVVIKVFDILGNEIETLVNEEKPLGTYELTWDAAILPNGVYFYQLKAGDFIQTKKMVLMK
jgi:hypothetical protein